MTPRRAALVHATEQVLRTMLSQLGQGDSAFEDRESMERFLAESPELSTSAMFAHLSDDELRATARACGLLGSGDRGEVLRRLERRAGFAATPHRVAPAKASPSRSKAGGRGTTRGSRRSSARSPSRGSTGRPPLLQSPPGEPDAPFVALDFETADHQRDSACALALVRVEAGEVVRTESRLIRPPRRQFVFTSIHGITWKQVADEPTFEELWPELEPLLEGVSFLAAHNAAFDRSVLEACCRAADLSPPTLPFLCTVKLARRSWPLPRVRLPDVCEHLGIPLQHHDATSDALACARIVLASRDASPP